MGLRRENLKKRSVWMVKLLKNEVLTRGRRRNTLKETLAGMESSMMGPHLATRYIKGKGKKPRSPKDREPLL